MLCENSDLVLRAQTIDELVLENLRWGLSQGAPTKEGFILLFTQRRRHSFSAMFYYKMAASRAM